MALVATQPIANTRTTSTTRIGYLAGLTAAAVALLGYHPYAEDGGIYAAAVDLRLHPELFPAYRGFAIAHTARSLFVPLIADLTRTLHLPLPATLLLAYIACIFATLLAASAVTREIFRSQTSQRWAIALLAVSLGVPIAGTSLYLADPYLTARSISTPLILFGISLILRRNPKAAFGLLAICFLIHPLMAAWAGVLYLAILARRSANPHRNTALLFAAAMAGMAAIHSLTPADSAAVRAASLSRNYWFVEDWQWYELLGMFAPPALLYLLVYATPLRRRLQPAARDLVLACATITVTVAAGSVLFVHLTNTSFLLARMQPLRLLHTVYLVFVLFLGAGIAAIRQRQIGWAICAAAAIGLLVMQRGIYSHSSYIELPGLTPSNGYEQAFQWARDNTPTDALFALDANYTTAPGEDADMFRAVARRSSLPDAAKDGGISSVMPSLADAWLAASRAQTNLNTATDADRIARLKPLNATWIVLPTTAATNFPCPYANATAKVCRIP